MYLMVLDDGETYSGISGCKILQVPDIISPDDIESVLAGLKDCDKKFWEEHVITEFQ